MIRTLTAIAATSIVLLWGLSVARYEPESSADQPRPQVQSRPISQPVGLDGLENLGTLPKVKRGQR